MIIVVTDGYALNPGDLSWSGISKFGELQYYDRSSSEEVPDRCAAADIIITNKTPISAETIASAKHLKMITVAATGFNIVDVQAATKRRIPVCNVPAYGTDSVAQHTIALMLELTNHVGLHEQAVRKGEWQSAQDWCLAKTPIIELAQKTIGIVGLGRIGKKVAGVAMALGMNVIFNDPGKRMKGTKAKKLDELFRESDFVSLHCPLKAGNEGFVNAGMIALMKPTAFLINTSRGQLIHEADLAEALKSNRITGAALDVLSKEPPPEYHPLIGLSNCIITPHNAWISFEARQRIMNTTVENIQKFLNGKPQHVVNAGF